FLVVVRVVEAEHRHQMLDRRKSIDRTAADTLGRRIARDEIGMLDFQQLELAEQRVVLRVRDLGGVLLVIALLMVADRVAELVQALYRRAHLASLSRRRRAPVRRTARTGPAAPMPPRVRTFERPRP